MKDGWDEAEAAIRDTLSCVTALIPNADVAGYVFGVGLVVSDHVLAALYATEQIVKTPCRLIKFLT